MAASSFADSRQILSQPLTSRKRDRKAAQPPLATDDAFIGADEPYSAPRGRPAERPDGLGRPAGNRYLNGSGIGCKGATVLRRPGTPLEEGARRSGELVHRPLVDRDFPSM
jgi:hypothetical protein